MTLSWSDWHERWIRRGGKFGGGGHGERTQGRGLVEFNNLGESGAHGRSIL